jgi:tRNA1Val (adenine37-N6)-methyltransferase
MSNAYFQFKQFRIEQDRCAMKVTTDACIQGAWTLLLPNVKRVLDVGTGTGLLALMLAQRAPQISIDAIEFDADAAAQARDNVAASPWKEVQVIEGDAANYVYGGKYDLVICNPPFFMNSLLSDKEHQNRARHTVAFTYDDLLRVATQYLNDEGYISILLPSEEYTIWKTLAEKAGWFEFSKLSVRHRAEAQVKRVVGLFGREPKAVPEEETLVIKKDAENYAQQFIDLLGPFYLDL